MEMQKAKKLAASLLKVGEGKIWINPEERQKVNDAMTKDDVRNLIKEGALKKRKEAGHSRGRARELAKKKRKRRRKGMGKRGGTKKTRRKRKREWVTAVRSQRKVLSGLKEMAKQKKVYSVAYNRIKGNFFKGKKHLEKFIEGDK